MGHYLYRINLHLWNNRNVAYIVVCSLYIGNWLKVISTSKRIDRFRLHPPKDRRGMALDPKCFSRKSRSGLHWSSSRKPRISWMVKALLDVIRGIMGTHHDQVTGIHNHTRRGLLPVSSEDQTMDPPYDWKVSSSVRLKTTDVFYNGRSLLATQVIICCEAVAYQIPTYHFLTLLLVRLKNPNLKTPFL